MARQFGLILKNCVRSLTALLIFNIAIAMSLGQTTPCCNPPSYTPPMYTPNPSVYQPMQPNPSATWNPGSSSAPAPNPMNVDMVKAQAGYSPPNPYGAPTPQQTEWYVNNHPVLSTLPWETRQQLINGDWRAANVLNTPYLGSTQNPFYQNGRVIPNWYLPSTWSGGTWLGQPSTSSGGTWQTANYYNVQPNGFLPTSNQYNPNSFFTSVYNPNSRNTTYNPVSSYNPSTPNIGPYQPSRQILSSGVRNNTVPTPQMPVQTRMEPVQTLSTRSLGTRLLDVEQAIADRERAMAVHEAAGDKIAQAIGYAELAELYVQSDKLELGFERIKAAERLSEEIRDPKLEAAVLKRNAASYMASGEFEQAITENHKALQILKQIGDEKGEAEAYSSVGWAEQSLGHTQNAVSSYSAALEQFERLGDKPSASRIRIALGSLYQSVGRFEKAVSWYTKAIPEASNDDLARVLINVAEMHLAMNKPSDALDRFEGAFPLLQANGNPGLEAAILAGMGRAYMALDAHRATPETHDLFERARSKMKEAGNRAGEAAVIASMGELEYWIAITSPTLDPTQRFTAALSNYNLALQVMREVGDVPGEIGVLTNTGLLYDAWQKYPEALKYYLQALERMNQLQDSARIDEFRLDIAGQSASLYERAILLEVLLKHQEEAFDLSERARARTLLDQLGNPRIETHLSPEFVERELRLRRQNVSLQRRIAQEASKSGPELDQIHLLSLESQRATVQKEYANFLTEVHLKNADYASFLSIQPLTLREAQQQLPPDVTLVSYFTTPNVTLAFVVGRGRFHLFTLDMSQAELAWLIATFLDFSSETGVPPSLISLYKGLIAPLKSEIRTPRLAIVPHGILHDLPFAALTQDGNRYLTDEYAVFTLPCVSTLPYIRARHKTSVGSALIFANNQEQGLSYLGHAYDEAKDVGAVLRAEPVLGEMATVTAFQQHAGDYDIIHLIAHFDHDEHNPQFSRAILGRGQSDDGSLELEQVLRLKLRKTSLVVLSGCQSQIGKWTRGDDIVSLSRAFIYAGSPSVMASLWSVDDEATSALMVSFYTHLKQGLSKAESLRRAQIELRQKYPHPYYWASFVLTGDPG